MSNSKLTYQPLLHKRVLVTRPREQADDLCRLLEEQGAVPCIFSTINIQPPENTGPIDEAIQSLNTYDWLVFTSVNGVRYFGERLQVHNLSWQDTMGLKLAAIGPATAESLRQHGLNVQIIPDEYVAEALLEHLGDVRGKKILLPRADIARDALSEGLAARGAIVNEVVAYRTVQVPLTPEEIEAMYHFNPEIITFTSSSTVKNFMKAVPDAQGFVRGKLVACIGPITSETARDAGLKVDIQASTYTIPGLVQGIVEFFERGNR